MTFTLENENTMQSDPVHTNPEALNESGFEYSEGTEQGDSILPQEENSSIDTEEMNLEHADEFLDPENTVENIEREEREENGEKETTEESDEDTAKKKRVRKKYLAPSAGKKSNLEMVVQNQNPNLHFRQKMIPPKNLALKQNMQRQKMKIQTTRLQQFQRKR